MVASEYGEIGEGVKFVQALPWDRTVKRGTSGYSMVTLIERFGTELNPDFSAKCQNFGGLVLFCIEADFCTQIRIFQRQKLFRELQDLQSFAPLQFQNLSKTS